MKGTYSFMPLKMTEFVHLVCGLLNTIIVEGKEERKAEVIIGARANLDVRKNFFSLRVVNKWNKLPEVVKEQRNVNGFKNHYDRWWEQTKLMDEV